MQMERKAQPNLISKFTPAKSAQLNIKSKGSRIPMEG